MNARTLIVSACIVAALLLPAAAIAGLTGSWRGDLELGAMKLPLVFNFGHAADNGLTCTLDSPQQGARGIPVDVVHASADSLSLACQAIGATYQAHIGDGVIEGRFSQRGYTFPLVLRPEQSVDVRRPQTPVPPFDYETIDTAFLSADGTRIAGTLVIPRSLSSAKMPVAVMVSGSGPQNRDEEIFEHKPFAVLAHGLAGKGIASFRYDDRGTAASGGNFAEATFPVFAADAAAALDFVRSFPQFSKAGVIGHSEGGTIGMELAAEGKTDFLVSLAGMAVDAKETLLAQNRHALERSGMSGADIKSALSLISLYFDELAKQYAAGKSEPVDVAALARENGVTVAPQIITLIAGNDRRRTPQFDCMVSLRPSQWLDRIAVPMLALNGSKDTQVDASSNLGLIRSSVKGAEVKELPGLNHLFQHCTTGEVSEYGEIKETMAPEVIDAIVSFIVEPALKSLN